MPMSRKDYRALAEAVSEAWRTLSYRDGNMDGADALRNVEKEIAVVLKRDNAAFDALRFHDAINKHGRV